MKKIYLSYGTVFQFHAARDGRIVSDKIAECLDDIYISKLWRVKENVKYRLVLEEIPARRRYAK